MKIRFYCDSGANIHSERSETIDLSDIGISENEWAEMTDEDKYELAKNWAYERLEHGWEELK